MNEQRVYDHYIAGRRSAALAVGVHQAGLKPGAGWVSQEGPERAPDVL